MYTEQTIIKIIDNSRWPETAE